MNILKTTMRAIERRPLIIILPAALMLLLSLLNAYNPILPLVSGIASITGSSVLDSLVSLVQFLINPSLIYAIVILFVGISIIASLFAGLVLSGYFNVVDKALSGLPGGRREFREGLKMFFLKYFLITLRAVPFLFLLMGFMLVSSIPAVIVTRAVTIDRPELLAAAVFVDIITVAVLFFALIFSMAYIFFWYPSALKVAKKPFSYGKGLVDSHFWDVVLKILIFDISFVVIHSLLAVTGVAVLQFLIGWIFDTVFLTTLTVYVISSFNTFNGRIESV